ncbi:unnamed protein product [Ceutorhynchus assimilis]|uniref:Putative inorganic phosphate cotransporter n=1 Tax=Ceutorhynchus assimilis TaxID=467358 RepID=A0A9N9MRS8_9CUCU|nr:unnamed protein product [Ceutorhynchus assimilis]
MFRWQKRYRYEPLGSNHSPAFGVRHFQMFILFILIFLAYGVRVILSVAIVAMTDPKASSNPNVPTYPDWHDKSIILSAFFWGYVLPQVIAGWLAGRYGFKWFLIAPMSICGCLCIFLPFMAAWFGSKGVMINRALQGLCQGFLFPSTHHSLSQWVPPDERSRLGTIVYAAGPFGTVVGMLVTGVFSASNFGWPLVFYLYGVLSLVWAIFALMFMNNSPADHPSITEAEKYYIEHSLGHTEEKTVHSTPWKSIWTSLPVWAILISHCGQNWGFWTLMTEIPNYMGHVMSFNIKSNSVLSALPYFALWVLSFFMSFSSDSLINRRILSRGNSRKLFNSIGLIIPAIALIFLGVTPADAPKRAVALLVIAVGFNSAIYCGFNVNHVDISPNHAGILMGITNGISNIFGIVAPLLVQYLVPDENNPDQWKIIFFIASGIYVATDLFYVLFGSGEVQKWNENPAARKNVFMESTKETEIRIRGYDVNNKGPKFGARHVQIGLIFLSLTIGVAMRTGLSIAIVAMTDNTTSPNPEIPTYDWDNNSLNQGFLFPSAHTLIGKWAPAEEISTLGIIVYSGISCGAILSSIVVGYTSSSWVGWPISFYIFGGLGIGWCVLYLIFGHSSPAVHPSITPEERRYIEASLGETTENAELPVPWWSIFTSIHLWAIVVANIGGSWGYAMLMTQTPTYLAKVLKFDIRANGLISAIPPMVGTITGLIFAPISDYLISKSYISRVNARRMFQVCGAYVLVICLFLLAYCASTKIIAVFLLTISHAAYSSTLCGYAVNHVDLSPRFSGIMQGFTNSTSQLIAIFSPLLVQFVVEDKTDASQWRIVFIVSAAFYFFSSTFYVIFASATRQKWDGLSTVSADKMERIKKHSVISVSAY